MDIFVPLKMEATYSSETLVPLTKMHGVNFINLLFHFYCSN